MKTFSKVSLLAGLIIASQSFAATEVNAKLGQNLKIMQDILQSSLGGQEHSSIGRVQHSYLFGQGVAFRVDSNSGWLRHFVMPPMPPVAPGSAWGCGGVFQPILQTPLAFRETATALALVLMKKLWMPW